MAVSKNFSVQPGLLWGLAVVLVVAGTVLPLKAMRALAPRQAQLEQQWLVVQALAAQAQALQSQTPAGGTQAQQPLPTLVQQAWGAQAQVQTQAGVQVIGLSQVPAAQLAQGLAQLRQGGQRFSAATWSVQDGRISGQLELAP